MSVSQPLPLIVITDLFKESWVRLDLRNPVIFVQTQAGETLWVLIKPSDTVFDLKVNIQKQKGIPPDQQLLIFRGQQLEGTI